MGVSGVPTNFSFMRIDVVELANIEVIYAAAPGEESAIPDAAGRAFQKLEALIPPRGRRVYGFWNPREFEYRACYVAQPGESLPEGLQRGRIPGGHYRRG